LGDLNDRSVDYAGFSAVRAVANFVADDENSAQILSLRQDDANVVADDDLKCYCDLKVRIS
jgi:hypothetical protein